MKHKTITIAKQVEKKLAGSSQAKIIQGIGYVQTVSDGVAKISGLPGVSYMELVEFAGGILGVAINLEETSVGVIILGDYLQLKEGDVVRPTGRLLSVGVGDEYLGRVINPVGEAVDGRGEIVPVKYYPLEKIAPSVVAREPVSTPMQTGIKAIDAMIPIGRGQRQLIIGDRSTGKTAIALDTIINQKDSGVVCIYVAIGQKTSRIAKVLADLYTYEAMQHTVIVAASASDPASYQYLAPYAGCALAEYYMDQGRDVLIVYDDLTKHAYSYRQISLVLRRPSGREAYPGDVFYLHSRLLERACRLNKDSGGGSITALPIIETQANDMSAYIPTNVISITDGQIFLESDLFYAGQRPAVNVGISVSRVGGAAQVKAMKKVAGNLRLDLAQYRSLAAFAQFSSDVDDVTKKQIDRGARMMELLKQARYVPMSVEKQIVVVWAGTGGQLDDVAVTRIRDFETGFLEYLGTKEKKLLAIIAKDKIISEESEKRLLEVISEYKKVFV